MFASENSSLIRYQTELSLSQSVSRGRLDKMRTTTYFKLVLISAILRLIQDELKSGT